MLDVERESLRLLPGTGTPVDQPLFGRCGLCREPVIYGVRNPTRSGARSLGGLILEPVAVRGGRWMLGRDGRYNRVSDEAWGQRGHRCRSRVAS